MLELWDRLPPNLRGTLRTLVTIALNGGVAAIGAELIDPGHFGLDHLKHVGIVFSVGALAAVINWLRQSPWKTADDRLMTTIARSVPVLMIAGLLGLAALSMPSCASAPPAGTYSVVGLKAFNADQLLKDVTALSETAINLNATTGPLHLKDRDTAIVRDFALSAGAGLVAYADGKGSLAVVVSAFDELTRKLSAEAALHDKLRYILALVADNIHRIPQ